MKRITREAGQSMQRIRVGMTGLAVVLVLIALASAIMHSASDEGSVQAIGASKADVVANMTAPANATADQQGKADEPLAELGVAPSSVDTPVANGAGLASQIEAEKQKDLSKVR